MQSGTMGFGSLIRVNKSHQDTSRYDAIFFEGIPNDIAGIYGIVFSNKVKRLYSSATSKGLIVDLRGCRYIHMTFAPTLVQTFYPAEKKYSLIAQTRNPRSPSHLDMIDAQDLSLTGLGYYGEKPIVLIVHEKVQMETHVIASILAELPNVMVVGRSSTGGRGGVIVKKYIGDSTLTVKNYLMGSAIRFVDSNHTSFNRPLQPDRLVNWAPTAAYYYDMGNVYDKCLEAALDCIDDYNAKH